MFYPMFFRIFAIKFFNNMNFKIDEKLYNKIQDYCKYNNLNEEDYINDCIVRQFNIDRYGDLNVLLNTEKNNTNSEQTVIESIFDEENENIIIKHSLIEDIVIPISTFPQLKVCVKEEKTTIDIEKDDIIQQKIISQTSTNKTKKRTLKT